MTNLEKALLMIQKEVLIHEYAHALSWTPGHMCLDDHGPEWGVAYSKVWMLVDKLQEL